LRTTGFGVIEKRGDQLSFVGSGCVKTQTGELPARLKLIFENLCEVIEEYQPEHVSIEQVFVNVNPKSTLLLGQARGAALCAAVSRNLIVAEYTALQIKQAVVGKGHAQKNQVQAMVKRLLNLSGDPSLDAADALACAICHAHGGFGLGKISSVGFRVKRGRWV
jgi:crossover junction endodeoxyribonuclease RuvC